MLGGADLVGGLRDHPAALRDAMTIVLHSDGSSSSARRLDALGAAGWRALGEDQRAALLARAAADDLGRVWDALDEAQRAAATQEAAGASDVAARLIGRIGAAAWRATDPALRETLMNAVLRDPPWIAVTAPAWAGMTDDERDVLARTAMACDDAVVAFRLLDDLGAARRAALTAEQRAALEARARTYDPWRVLAWRAADAGWTALTADERAAVLAAAEQEPWRTSVLLHAVGATGLSAMRADERERLASVVRLSSIAAVSPTLWATIAGDDLPPATTLSWRSMLTWRAEDAESDLSRLPAAHQAAVLALAPWRPEDATAGASRMQRLRAAWDALTTDARVALALAHPSIPPTVAAAARRCGGAAAARDAAGETVVRGAATTDGAAARRIVGAMLRTPDDWRAWMAAFAPTDGDPSETWDAWRRAARRGILPDPAMCARLADEDSSLRRTRLRAGR